MRNRESRESLRVAKGESAARRSFFHAEIPKSAGGRLIGHQLSSLSEEVLLRTVVLVESST